MAPRRAAAILAVLAAAVFPVPRAARAQSVFSVRGPGTPGEYSGARSRAMGAGELAVVDSVRGSLANLSLGAAIHQVTFGATFNPEMTWVKDNSAKTNWAGMTISSIWLYVPTGSHGVAACGLRVERSTRAEIHWTEEYQGSPVSRGFRRTGDQFSIPVAWLLDAPRHHVSASLGVDFLIASSVEDVSWGFTGTGFPGTTAETKESLHGAAPAVSVTWRPLAGSRLGLVYRTGTHLEGDRSTRQEAGQLSSADTRIRYPERAGVGASVQRGGVIWAGGFTWENWSRFERTGDGVGTDGPVKDSYTWGLGFEAGGPDARFPVIGRHPLRAGVRQSTLPTVAFGDGSRLRETLLSLGTGWLADRGGVTVDLSLEAGLRGSISHQGAREGLFRMAISLSGREPWKRPERRGNW